MLAAILATAFWRTGAAAEERIWIINNGDRDVSVAAPAPPNGGARPETARLQFEARPVALAAVDAAGLVFVALAGDEGAIVAYDAASLKELWRAEAGVSLREIDIAADPAGGAMLVALGKQTLVSLNPASGKEIGRSKVHASAKMVSTGADRSFAAIAGYGGSRKVGIFDLSRRAAADDEAPSGGVISFGGGLARQAAAPRRGLIIGQLDGLNGFEVGDLSNPSGVRRVKHDNSLGLPSLIKELGFLNLDGFSRCYGLAVNGDETEVWATCGKNLNVHSLVETGYPQIAHMKLPSRGLWAAFSPDGARAYVSLSDEDAVLVIDAASKQFIETIPVGDDPVRAVAVSIDAAHNE